METLDLDLTLASTVRHSSKFSEDILQEFEL